MSTNRQERVIAFFRNGKPAFDAKTGGDYYGYEPGQYCTPEGRKMFYRENRVKEAGVKRLSTNGAAIFSYESWMLIERRTDGHLYFGEKMYARAFGPVTKRHMELVYHAFKDEAREQGVPDAVYHTLASTLEMHARHGKRAAELRRIMLRDAPMFHAVDWERVTVEAAALHTTRGTVPNAMARMGKAYELIKKAKEARDLYTETWARYNRGEIGYDTVNAILHPPGKVETYRPVPASPSVYYDDMTIVA